jgi:HEAT repeat protein
VPFLPSGGKSLRKRALFFLFLALAGGLLYYTQTQREARYKDVRFSTWLKRLDDADPAVRAEAARALTTISMGTADKEDYGERAMPALTRHALHDDDPGARNAALRGLSTLSQNARSAKAQARKRSVAQTLLAALQGDDLEARRRAPVALALVLRIEPRGPVHAVDAVDIELQPAALKALTAALDDEDEEARAAALLVLAQAARVPAKAVPGLVKVLKDDKLDARRRAAIALGEVQPLPAVAVPELIRGLGDKDDILRSACARALRKGGPAVIGPMLEVLGKTTSNQQREQVGLVLLFGGAQPQAKHVPTLIHLLASPHRDAWRTAARLLVDLRPRPVAELKAAVQNGPELARRRAAGVLAAMGLPGAPALIELRKDGDEQARRLAAAAVPLALAPTARAVTVVTLGAVGPVPTALALVADARRRFRERVAVIPDLPGPK